MKGTTKALMALCLVAIAITGVFVTVFVIAPYNTTPYFEDFFQTGNTGNWTLWEFGDGSTAGSMLFTSTDTGTNKVLNVSIGSSNDGIRLTALTNWTDINLTGRIRPMNASDFYHIGISQLSNSSGDSLVALSFRNDGTIKIIRRENSVWKTDIATGCGTWSVNNWYYFRIEANATTNNVTAKVWTTTEPADPTCYGISKTRLYGTIYIFTLTSYFNVDDIQAWNVSVTEESPPPDTTPPSWSWQVPVNNSYSLNVSTILFNGTATETPNGCKLDNGTTNFTMTISGNDCYYTMTGLTNQTKYCGKVWLNDSSGNLNVSSQRCQTINLTNYASPPASGGVITVTISSPTYKWYNIIADLNVTATGAINSCNYNIDGGSNTTMANNTPTNYYYEIKGIGYGSHTAYVTCLNGSSSTLSTQKFFFNQPHLHTGSYCYNITITEQGYGDITEYSYPVSFLLANPTPFWNYSIRVFDNGVTMNGAELPTDVYNCTTNGTAGWCNSTTVRFPLTGLSKSGAVNYSVCFDNSSTTAVKQDWAGVMTAGDPTDGSSHLWFNMTNGWNYVFCRRAGQRIDNPEDYDPPKPINVICEILSPDDPYNLLEDTNHNLSIDLGFQTNTHSYITNQGVHDLIGGGYSLQDEDGNTTENKLSWNGSLCKTHSFRWVNNDNNVQYFINYTYCDGFPAIYMEWENLISYTAGTVRSGENMIGFSDALTIDDSTVIKFGRQYECNSGWDSGTSAYNNATCDVAMVHNQSRNYTMGIKNVSGFNAGMFVYIQDHEYFGLSRDTSVSAGEKYTAYEYWLTDTNETASKEFSEIIVHPPSVLLDGLGEYSPPPDTTPPTVSITNPANGTLYNSKFYINVTISESGTCYYNFDAGTNTTMSGSGTSWNVEGNPSSQGTRRIYIWCNDTSDNWGVNSSVYINWDTVVPKPSFVSSTPANNSYTQNQNWVYFNVSSNEAIGACRLDNYVSNTTMTVNGNYCYYNLTGQVDHAEIYRIVWVNDMAGNWNKTADINVTINLTNPDLTDPVISSVAASSVTTTTAIISWTTDEEATTGLTMSPSGTYSNSSSHSTSHSISLSGLTSSTEYTYYVESCDWSDNCATAGSYTFTTSAETAPPDEGGSPSGGTHYVPTIIPYETPTETSDTGWDEEGVWVGYPVPEQLNDTIDIIQYDNQITGDYFGIGILATFFIILFVMTGREPTISIPIGLFGSTLAGIFMATTTPPMVGVEVVATLLILTVISTIILYAKGGN